MISPYREKSRMVLPQIESGGYGGYDLYFSDSMEKIGLSPKIWSPEIEIANFR